MSAITLINYYYIIFSSCVLEILYHRRTGDINVRFYKLSKIRERNVKFMDHNG